MSYEERRGYSGPQQVPYGQGSGQTGTQENPNIFLRFPEMEKLVQEINTITRFLSSAGLDRMGKAIAQEYDVYNTWEGYRVTLSAGAANSQIAPTKSPMKVKRIRIYTDARTENDYVTLTLESSTGRVLAKNIYLDSQPIEISFRKPFLWQDPDVIRVTGNTTGTVHLYLLVERVQDPGPK